MDNVEIRLILRKKALETVRESTQMLKEAVALLKSGNGQRAARLQKEARDKRVNSVWMMEEANKIERDSQR